MLRDGFIDAVKRRDKQLVRLFYWAVVVGRMDILIQLDDCKLFWRRDYFDDVLERESLDLFLLLVEWSNSAGPCLVPFTSTV